MASSAKTKIVTLRTKLKDSIQSLLTLREKMIWTAVKNLKVTFTRRMITIAINSLKRLRPS